MSKARFCNKGFSLLELVISLGFLSILIFTATDLLLSAGKTNQQMISQDSLQFIRSDYIREVTDQCIIANTKLDYLNKALTCLDAGTCSDGTAGNLTLKGKHNEVLFSQYQVKGRLFNADGGDCSENTASCTRQLNLSYKISCPAGDCKRATLTISGRFSEYSDRSPTQLNQQTQTVSSKINFSKYDFDRQVETPKMYKTCSAAYADGKTASGIFWLDPDGAGGVCPFQVYCDQGRAGGGWALVANSTRLDYETIVSVIPPLLKGQVGRLSEENIDALLKASQVPATGNNVLVDISTGTATDYILSFSAVNSGAAKFTSQQTFCQGPEIDAIQTAKSGGDLAFIATDGTSKIGFTGSSFQCHACSGSVCGVCEINAATCPTTKVGGAVWVK